MNGDQSKPGDNLTSREREVMDLMARGLTNGEIAERLDISFATAKNHVSAIIAKLGVRSREDAVRAWRQHQRPGARLGRTMRGLAAGVGMWQVSAGATAVAVVGVGVATVVQLGSGDTPLPADHAGPVPTATPAPPTEGAAVTGILHDDDGDGEFEQVLDIDDVSPAQQEALADGYVSRDEYEAAIWAAFECIEDAGYEPIGNPYPDPTGTRLIYGFLGDGPLGIGNPSSDAEACQDYHSRLIELTWAKQNRP